MATLKRFTPAPARLAVAATLLGLMAGEALAARPDTRAMTCAQARGLIAQYGSLVMTTGQYTYDRIVHNRGFCGPGQDTQWLTAPTLDTPSCRVGYVCRERLFFGR